MARLSNHRVSHAYRLHKKVICGMNGEITHTHIFFFICSSKYVNDVFIRHKQSTQCLCTVYPFHERENGNVILRQRATKQTQNQFLSTEPNSEDASNSYA